MVVCAVTCEPVSNRNSLLTGNLTGKFAILGTRQPISMQESTVPQGLFERFPTKNNRENFLRIREFSDRNREFNPPK